MPHFRQAAFAMGVLEKLCLMRGLSGAKLTQYVVIFPILRPKWRVLHPRNSRQESALPKKIPRAEARGTFSNIGLVR
jgi:hypothetical protein